MNQLGDFGAPAGRLDPDPADVRGWLDPLAAIDRASCSPGEHHAAYLIAGVLEAQGADVSLELQRVHGTYWWPLGVTSALGLAAAWLGRRGHRGLGACVGVLGTALVVDEVGAGQRWLRRLLPKQRTANVVGRVGEEDARATLIVVAHHDAAHTGVFFDPRIARLLGRWSRRRRGNGRHPHRPGSRRAVLVPMMPIAAAPALAGAGALTGLRLLAGFGTVVCGGIIGSFAHIAASRTVPGANDNLTGVVTLLSLARALRQRPVPGLRVILLSTGAEEALMEGMRAYATRHLPDLDPESTYVLCVDAVGSADLVLAEAEGMLQVRPYDTEFKDLIAGCAAQAGVQLRRGVEMRLGTDGYVPLRRGYRSAMLMSLDPDGGASNYHWPTDTPERVDYRTLSDAVRLVECVVRRLGTERRASADGVRTAPKRDALIRVPRSMGDGRERLVELANAGDQQQRGNHRQPEGDHSVEEHA